MIANVEKVVRSDQTFQKLERRFEIYRVIFADDQAGRFF